MLKRLLKSKRFWLWTAGIFALAVYACGLVLISEAAAQQSLGNFKEFLLSSWGKTALWNSAFLVFFLLTALGLLVRKISVSVGLVSVAYFGFHLANAMKMIFRNEPVYPWDLTLLGEVGNIASSMEFQFSPPMIVGAVYVLLGLTAAILADVFLMKKIRTAYWKEALAALLCGAVVLVSGSMLLSPDYLEEKGITFISWNPKGSYRQQGFLYSFAAAGYSAEVKEPENYGEKAVQETLADLKATDGTKANVIIWMSEAFVDLESAEKLHFDRELTPNFNRLKEQYLSGRCLTSEFGGGTANSEYEVLTGYSTYQLPSGTIAYMNVVNRDVDSYVSYLNSRNYYTVALHPYQRTFFSRDKAYTVLGFDDFYSEEHFENAERVRSEQYISDMALTERIIAEYEKNQSTDQGFFCHAVSMQNHASYPAGDFEETVGLTSEAELTTDEYEAIRTYATGLTQADEALGALVDYFAKQEEPTVILFFGDHIPALGTDTAQLAERIGYAGGAGTVEGMQRTQSTPYLIWNNFEEQPTAAKETLSMFHLVPYMTRMLGMERPVFHAYMDTLFEEIRGVTRQLTLTADGTLAYQVPETVQKKWEEYLLLVYDGLYGKRYGNERLYKE